MFKRSVMIPVVLGMGVLLVLFGWPPVLRAQEKILIKAGDDFPAIALKTPAQAKERTYLGIPRGDRFTVNDIQAEIVLVEILNVYCGACQRQAPSFNQLFELIQSDPDTRKRIKMIGIAVGNDEEEITLFKDSFKIPYPIVPDTRYQLHGAIGGGPTPFSIIVRRVPRAKSALVADAHLGIQEDIRGLLGKMNSLAEMDLAAIREKGAAQKAQVIVLKPPISEQEIQTRVKAAFSEGGRTLKGFESVTLAGGGVVYAGKVEQNGKIRRMFAQVVSEVPTCDECHETHFIYIFQANGRIVRFIPIQLTKWGNEDWNAADITKMRKRIVGRYIYNPFVFNHKVDAVTSATITSAAIFRGLNKGQEMFKELKAKGLI